MQYKHTLNPHIHTHTRRSRTYSAKVLNDKILFFFSQRREGMALTTYRGPPITGHNHLWWCRGGVRL